jgi:hypothetical protein
MLYFEKLCCFARYRFLKPFLRRFNPPQKPKSTSSTNQFILSLPWIKPVAPRRTSIPAQEYLWIAGHQEPITTFEPVTSWYADDSGKSFFHYEQNTSSSHSYQIDVFAFIFISLSLAY